MTNQHTQYIVKFADILKAAEFEYINSTDVFNNAIINASKVGEIVINNPTVMEHEILLNNFEINYLLIFNCSLL